MDNDGYEYEVTKVTNHGKLNSKVIVIVVIAIFVIVAIIIGKGLITDNIEKNTYEKLEQQMVETAKQYITNNNIVISRETYFNTKTLGIANENECSSFSGVIVDKNGQYQPYLKCAEYETNITNSSEYVTLQGQRVLLLPKGTNYVESGYRSSKEIKVVSYVGTEVGVYNILYNVMSSGNIIDVAVRKVIVLDDPEVAAMYPTFTLKGSAVDYVLKGYEYNDLGVDCYDSKDGNLTNMVTVENNININKEGEYTISYMVTNSQGYTNYITRKVYVINNFSDLYIGSVITPTATTSGNITITLNVIGNNYDYTVLPNGTRQYQTSFNYVATENGVYDFFVYDKSGKVLTKTIAINNIYRVKPTATCKAVIERSVSITVSNESTTLSGYNYRIDSVTTGYQNYSTYTYNVNKANNISVGIKDSYGNTNDIVCSIEDNSYLSRQIYVNSSGKNCLSGYVCYNQEDYTDPSYKYCSTDSSNGCGPISQYGCSITSMTTAISIFGLKSNNGNLYTPYTLLREVYNKTGCSACSGSTTFKRVANLLNLSATNEYVMNQANLSKLVEFLNNGYPVIVRAGEGPFTSSGHLMAVLGINKEGKVYLYNPGGRTTSTLNSNYSDDTWINKEDLLTGHITWFLAIGPNGMY